MTNQDSPMEGTFTGREVAAKMRDGEFDTVEVFAEINTYNTHGEKQGTAVATRVEIPESTLMDRLRKIRISIERVRNDTAYVELRA